MKYSVLWASSRNGGDDIQTLAAINLLRKNGINEYSFIDRENMSNYSGPPVRLVINGWFTNNAEAFLPPESVTPLFISFHCAPHRVNLIINNLNYFKKHEPIGCRDTWTTNLFRKFGVESYFSGCLSMCFDEVKEKGDDIYTVDSTHPTGKSIAHRIPQGIQYSIKDRLTHANKILDLYKRARLVITSRLHCALPCRAFNTDVLFTLRSFYVGLGYEKDHRFFGLRKYIAKGKVKVDREIINERKEITKSLFKSLL